MDHAAMVHHISRSNSKTSLRPLQGWSAEPNPLQFLAILEQNSGRASKRAIEPGIKKAAKYEDFLSLQRVNEDFGYINKACASHCENEV
jgi:hypothetical protein